MNPSLIDFIKCLDCEAEDIAVQSIEPSSSGQVNTGYLQCRNCNSIFPIVQGVPIMFQKELVEAFLLPGELEVIHKHHIPIPLDSSRLNAFIQKQVKTHKNWSFQWLEMDTDTWNEDWAQAFGNLEQLHYYDMPIKPEDYDGKTICEASCGYGRVVKVLHKRPGRYVAFDISGAAYKAQQLFPDSKKLDIIRANMHFPPFKKEVFDIVFSPRAIHHTGNMELAIKKLIPLIKKDGIFAYSVYSRENNFLMWGIIEPLKRISHPVTPRCILLFFASILAVIMMAIIHLIYVPLDKINMKFLPLHHFFIIWSNFSFTTLKINMYDFLHAPYAEYISDGQIKKWEKKFNLEPIEQILRHDTVWGYSSHKR